jgi:hypothetical protein
MVFVPVPDVCAIEMRFTRGGQQVENTLSFHNNLGVDTTNMLTLATLCAEWWYNTLRAVQANSLVHTEVYARSLDSDVAPTVTYTGRSGATGALATGTTLLPNNVTFCISFRTNGRGRSYRGRNYLLGMTSAWKADVNTVDTGYANAAVAAYEELLPGGTYDPTPYRWVVASRYYNKAPRNPGIAIPITTVLYVDNNIDSQARRLTGRGT